MGTDNRRKDAWILQRGGLNRHKYIQTYRQHLLLKSMFLYYERKKVKMCKYRHKGEQMTFTQESGETGSRNFLTVRKQSTRIYPISTMHKNII